MSDIVHPGARYGHLTVLRCVDERHRTALCFCYCQRSVVVSAEELISGLVTSCGCQPMTLSARSAFRALQREWDRRRNFDWHGGKL